MERLKLALRVVIGQAREIAAAFQGVGLGCGRLVGHRWLLFRVYCLPTYINAKTGDGSLIRDTNGRKLACWKASEFVE